MKRLRWGVRPTHVRTFPDGTQLQVRAFGVQIGYWPCLSAPFVALSVNKRRYEIWFGLEGYQ